MVTSRLFHQFAFRTLIGVGLLAVLASCSSGQRSDAPQAGQPFTIAVIPDTQNYLDYRHQTEAGYALDGSELFIEQMQYVADNAYTRGGDIVFVASVGDVWQHQTLEMDVEHVERGFGTVDNPYFALEIETTEQTTLFEMPLAVEGYRIIADAGLPFGVAPGNHDYDAMWSVEAYPPNLDKNPRELTMTAEDLGLLHIGGLDNFRAVFGADSDFFRDKPWYVASYKGGANSAQVFSAGGYEFLHIALEMQAGDEVLAWAQGVLDAHPGKPTIITTHDYLSVDGERKPNPIVDLVLADPDYHNSAEQLWQKLVAPNDQVFMVLCGHQHGQSMRIDENQAGNQVYQILADYQDRGQAALDAGQPPSPRTGRAPALGDGWFRLMRFDMEGALPSVKVQTWSSHYGVSSGNLEDYAKWYKHHEQPGMTDQQFYEADEFTLELVDFRERFGEPR